MHEWFFDLSDIPSWAFRLMFLVWLYIFMQKYRKKGQPEEQQQKAPRKKRRRKRQAQQKAPAQATPTKPDADDAKLASKGTQYGKGMYHDGDKPVHTDNETLQHDKGHTYHDGEKPVHTDNETLQHDKGHTYHDGEKPAYKDKKTSRHDQGKVFVDKAKAQPQILDAQPEYFSAEELENGVLDKARQGLFKPVRHKLVRPALAQQFIMSQVFAKPKGLK